MSAPPRDRSEFWIRFGCAFAIFGFLGAWGALPLLDEIGIPATCAVWVALTIGISIYAAKHGDEAWQNILAFIGSVF